MAADKWIDTSYWIHDEPIFGTVSYTGFQSGHIPGLTAGDTNYRFEKNRIFDPEAPPQWDA